MSDCCKDKEPKRGASECCAGGGEERVVLFYACSGAANVAEIADHAVREMAAAGHGAMFCLAGVGAGIQGMVQTAKDADLNIIIDGCPLDCGKKIFEQAGITNYMQITVTDLGIENVKGARCSEGEVDVVVKKAKDVLSQS